MSKTHPATFTRAVFETMKLWLPPADSLTLPMSPTPGCIVFDPFAGEGVQLASLSRDGYVPVGIELEAAFIKVPCVAQGNALFCHEMHAFNGGAASPHVIFTSPCYGNRYADKHNRSDKCKSCGGRGTLTIDMAEVPCGLCKGSGLSPRKSYTHALQDVTGDMTRQLHADNSGGMQWGPEYRALHEGVWWSVSQLKTAKRFILNIKNHQRDGEVQRVAEWHLAELIRLGWNLTAIDHPKVAGMRMGKNREKREPFEFVFVLDR